MNRIFLFAALFLCLGMDSTAQVRGKYTISGDVSALAEGWAAVDSLSLIFMEGHRIDTVAMPAGIFEFSGALDALYVPSAYLRIIGPDTEDDEPVTLTIPVFLEPGDIRISIRQLPDEGMYDIIVAGTPSNDLMSGRMSRYYDLNYRMLDLAHNSELTDEEKMAVIYELYEQQDSLMKFIYRDNRESAIAPMLALQRFYGTNDFLEAGRELAWLEKNFPDHPDLHDLESVWQSMEGLTVGDPLPDVTGLDSGGSTRNLRELKGGDSYLLIDFWSSLSGPNIEDFGQIRQLPDSYEGKPLRLVGISTDNSRRVWQTSLERYAPAGIQLWDGAHTISRAFHITNYPTRFLVDPEGTIIAKGNFTVIPDIGNPDQEEYF